MVNKTDGLDEDAVVNEFARFGVERIIPIAAAHQRGIPDLLEEIIPELPAEKDVEIVADEPGRIRIAFLGRPNVGKSTLVNRLLGEERMIASDVPGTTRDSIAVDMERDGKRYRLIDTAGLRRRAKVEEAVEKFSVFKTLQAIENAQVVVVMLDAGEGVTEQDATVLGYVLDSGRALVVAVNKWDDQDKYTREQALSMLERKLSFCEWAERMTISAKNGTGLQGAVQGHPSRPRLGHARVQHRRSHQGAAGGGGKLPAAGGARPRGRRCKFAHPGGANPPTFIVHGKRLTSLTESYRRYLENFFRKRFKLVGTPIKFVFKEGENPYEGKKNVLTDRQVQGQAPPDEARQGQVIPRTAITLGVLAGGRGQRLGGRDKAWVQHHGKTPAAAHAVGLPGRLRRARW